MTDLRYVPRHEFERVCNLNCSRELRTRVFATACRINTLYMIARAGSGHIGTSFSSIDIVSWLFLNELRLPEREADNLARDVYFSSKGHDAPALYAVLTGTGRLEFDHIHRLRRLDGLPGHPDVGTPFVETNTGPLGMGISKAKGMVLANRRLGREGNVFVLTGDGELQEGQIWESLAAAANRRLGEIVVIVDHNKVQSDTWVKNVSDLGDLEAKFASFGWSVERCDGHDLAALAASLACAKGPGDRPKVIIADTVKGKGVSFMEPSAMTPEEEFYRFHSGAPDRECYDRATNELIADAKGQLAALGAHPLALESAAWPARTTPSASERLIAAYSRALVKQAEENEAIVVLDADLLLDTGQIPLRDAFPDRFYECGIAEQDMVSQAGGMALKGLLPVVHSFACFLSTRPNEQIYNNATERTKIIYVGSLAGLLPAGPGHSHQSVRDIATLGAIPGLVLIEPSCEREVAMALDYAVRGTHESTYLRLVSIPCDIGFALPDDYTLEVGRGVALTEGQDAVLFAYGPVMLDQAVAAAHALRADHGIGLKVVNLPWLNRVDSAWLAQTVRGYRTVFTLDDHYVAGGQGERVACALGELGLLGEIAVKRFGLTDVPLCGQNDEVLRAHRLDAESLTAAIAEACAKTRQ